MFEDEEKEIIEGDATEVVETAEPEEVKPKERTVPLNTFLSEKERRKALERRLAELEALSVPKEEEELVTKYTKAGFDEEAARMIAKDFARLATRQKVEHDVVAEELDDLVLESDFYDDAKTYEKEIRAEIAKSGCDVKTAYIRVRDPAQRAMEIANRTKSPAALKAQPTSKPSAPTGNALTEAERDELKMMQTAFPWQKWDADSYRTYKRKAKE